MSQINEVDDNEHSPLGASSAERWIPCPGSVRATNGMPGKSGAASLYGTAAHTVSEWCRKQNVPAKTFLGQVLRIKKEEGGTADITVDADMVAYVQTFVDKVEEEEGEALIEVRVRYDHIGGVPGGFGTLDDARLKPAKAKVTDFKSGAGKKYAKMNPQLMLYATGIIAEYHWLYSFETFTLAISQPRIDHYDEWEVSVADLIHWFNTVAVPAALRTQDDDAPFKAGDWCFFCKIRETCKVRMKSVFDVLADDFEEVGDAVEKTEKRITENAKLTNDEIVKILRVAPLITKYLSQLYTYAAAEKLAGRTVGDMKFVEGRSSRDFGAPEATVVERVLKTVPDLKKEELYTKPELLSMPKIEAVAGKKYFAAATKTKEPGVLHDLVKKTPGKPKLVFGDDPRPEYIPDPTTEFEEVEEE